MGMKNFIIPAIHNRKDFVDVVENYQNTYILLKIGEINTLPQLVRGAHERGKKVIVHQDSIGGLAKDSASIQYLAKIGVDAVNTNKLQCINMIKKEKMIAILGFFAIDSLAIENSIRGIAAVNPDYGLIMPACLPEFLLEKIIKRIKIPLLGGGLCSTPEAVSYLARVGLKAVISSEKSLWDKI